MPELHYHISATTNLSMREVVELFTGELDKAKYYNITEATTQLIKFQRSNWTFESRSAGLKAIDGGRLQLNSDEVKTVDLYFHISLWGELFLMGIIIIAVVFSGQPGLLAFSALIFLGLMLRIVAVGNNANEILKKCTGDSSVIEK